MKGGIIFIGGAPTTGKSMLAQALGKHLEIPWISTDQIRTMAQAIVSRDTIPKLFNPEDYTAERFLTEFSAEQIVTMEMEQGDAVWPAVKAFINDSYPWDQGFIMEGVNILPHLVAEYHDDKHIKAVFLVDEDADRMRDVVFNRGLWADARTYPDDVKEKEIEWASLFSHKLKVEAEKYGYPMVEVQKAVDDLQKVLKALNLYKGTV